MDMDILNIVTETLSNVDPIIGGAAIATTVVLGGVALYKRKTKKTNDTFTEYDVKSTIDTTNLMGITMDTKEFDIDDLPTDTITISKKSAQNNPPSIWDNPNTKEMQEKLGIKPQEIELISDDLKSAELLEAAIEFDKLYDRENAVHYLNEAIRLETHDKEKLRLRIIAQNYHNSMSKRGSPLIDIVAKLPSFLKDGMEILHIKRTPSSDNITQKTLVKPSQGIPDESHRTILNPLDNLGNSFSDQGKLKGYDKIDLESSETVPSISSLLKTPSNLASTSEDENSWLENRANEATDIKSQHHETTSVNSDFLGNLPSITNIDNKEITQEYAQSKELHVVTGNDWVDLPDENQSLPVTEEKQEQLFDLVTPQGLDLEDKELTKGDPVAREETLEELQNAFPWLKSDNNEENTIKHHDNTLPDITAIDEQSSTSLLEISNINSFEVSDNSNNSNINDLDSNVGEIDLERALLQLEEATNQKEFSLNDQELPDNIEDLSHLKTSDKFARLDKIFDEFVEDVPILTENLSNSSLHSNKIDKAQLVNNEPEFLPAEITYIDNNDKIPTSIESLIENIAQEAEEQEKLLSDTTTIDDNIKNDFYKEFGSMINDLHQEVSGVNQPLKANKDESTSQVIESVIPTQTYVPLPPTETLEVNEHDNSNNEFSEIELKKELSFKQTIWVNWMLNAAGKTTMKESIFEIDSKWGTKPAIEQLKISLTKEAGINSNGSKNTWAVLSVFALND